MERPDDFLIDAWEQLPEDEKKEIYLTHIVTSENAPRYLAGALLENDEITLDKKIDLAEKIIKGELLNPAEIKIIGITD